jgi:hypothetical protein
MGRPRVVTVVRPSLTNDRGGRKAVTARCPNVQCNRKDAGSGAEKACSVRPPASRTEGTKLGASVGSPAGFRTEAGNDSRIHHQFTSRSIEPRPLTDRAADRGETQANLTLVRPYCVSDIRGPCRLVKRLAQASNGRECLQITLPPTLGSSTIGDNPDRERSRKRAFEAMMQMKKIDIASLEAARRG